MSRRIYLPPYAGTLRWPVTLAEFIYRGSWTSIRGSEMDRPRSKLCHRGEGLLTRAIRSIQNRYGVFLELSVGVMAGRPVKKCMHSCSLERTQAKNQIGRHTTCTYKQHHHTRNTRTGQHHRTQHFGIRRCIDVHFIPFSPALECIETNSGKARTSEADHPFANLLPLTRLSATPEPP